MSRRRNYSDKFVAEVTLRDVRKVVVPYWRGRGSKDALLLQNLHSVFDSAIAHGYRLDNPTANLARILPKVKSRRRRSATTCGPRATAFSHTENRHPGRVRQ